MFGQLLEFDFIRALINGLSKRISGIFALYELLPLVLHYG